MPRLLLSASAAPPGCKIAVCGSRQVSGPGIYLLSSGLLQCHVLRHQRHIVRALTVYPECSCASLDRISVTRPHFTGSEATSLAASTTPSQVQSGRPGVEVAVGLNPDVQCKRHFDVLKRLGVGHECERHTYIQTDGRTD